VPLLKSAPGLRPVAIFDEIRRRHPEIGVGVRRTLERRIRAWRALNGAAQDVIFRQEHPPGRLGLSDFTDMGDHGVSNSGSGSVQYGRPVLARGSVFKLNQLSLVRWIMAGFNQLLLPFTVSISIDTIVVALCTKCAKYK
jgi:hypothetical protein